MSPCCAHNLDFAQWVPVRYKDKNVVLQENLVDGEGVTFFSSIQESFLENMSAREA